MANPAGTATRIEADVIERLRAFATSHSMSFQGATNALLRRALDLPLPGAARWEYREVGASQEEGARDLRDELLNDGWEPFAVYTHANDRFVVLCMRRLRPNLPIC